MRYHNVGKNLCIQESACCMLASVFGFNDLWTLSSWEEEKRDLHNPEFDIVGMPSAGFQ